ncbi:hypothetical protein OLMES_5487 [Oleiphilus messinensis]|uniref:Uncharacterized protein n=1 Tax=Oleiphilus messinensis TaxID=141451 RepID=A0A1Y0IG26_9GAMM|nr:hypothetical protein OLMES_5487 [Oleiphilus messinensis]
MSFDMPVVGCVSFVVLAYLVSWKWRKKEKYCGICHQELQRTTYIYKDSKKKLKICAVCNGELRKQISRRAVNTL